jgi:hypothetical protein
METIFTNQKDGLIWRKNEVKRRILYLIGLGYNKRPLIFQCQVKMENIQ